MGWPIRLLIIQPCWVPDLTGYSRLVFAFVGICIFSLSGALFAQEDRSTAHYILPQIGERGSEMEVYIEGFALDTAEEVLFYKPGITCTKIEPITEIPHTQQTGQVSEVKEGGALRLTFKIAPDAVLGEYFLRVRTRKKLSELLSFWVSPFPIVHEENALFDKDEARNDQPEFAQPIPLNCTVAGYHPQGYPNDVDLYRIQLEKGQLCTVQILNSRLGTYHYAGLTDMAIEVTSPDGKRVARCDDTDLFTQDPFVSFYAPESGEYLVTTRQNMDYEAPLRHYAMHIGGFPRPVVTYPLGGEAGTSQELQIWFADGSTQKRDVKIPSSVGLFEKSLLPLTDLISWDEKPIPSPNLFQTASFGDVFELAEKETSPTVPQIVDSPLPIALNGIIEKEGERDWFRITARKGERYRVRAYAKTLGSPLDPFVWIRPAEGNPSSRTYEEDDSLWDGHDWEGHHYRHQVRDRLDPIFMFEPDEDGDYLVGVGDTRREYGEHYVYRLEIQPHRNSVFTYYTPYPSQAAIVRDNIGIHKGAMLSRPLSILNGFGSLYDGPLTLEARGLPKEIEFICPTFTKNDPVILAMFRCSDSAKFSSGLFELIPKAVDSETAIVGGIAETSLSTDRRGSYAMVFNRTRKFSWAVLEEAPFSIKLEQPKIGLAKNAELDLKVAVTRREGFTGALYLEMDWLPTGVSKQPPLIIPSGETEALYKLSATAQAQAGNYQVSITGREYEGGNPRNGIGFHYVASPLVEIEVSDPYLSIELERSAVEQGKPGTIKGKISALRPFSGTASVRLLRLPKGVTLTSEPKIRSGDKEVVFPIKVAKDALVGQYKEISCAISIRDSGQLIEQQSGSGVLRIDPARE